MAQTPLVGYRLIVVALIAVGFFSFGLWVHHMFTTGIPALSLGFFSAASMAVAIPSGIQVFAWIATIAKSRGQFRITTPSLFVLGFLFIFTVGGLTGVMVALVPFDWQAHDTYFVVAHFHYVLVGGMVFPLFATFYYWVPLTSRRMLSERIGRWVFGLMFAGFNIAFLPMHLTGLLGMPRRVWTYSAAMGWGELNLASTMGAFVFAAGVALFLFDLVRRFRRGKGPENPWGAGTLEWLASDVYSTRSIPLVTSREPLWEQPSLAKEVEAGHHYLPNAPTGGRETLVTSTVEAEPQYVMQIPGPGWAHVFAAVFTAAFFLLLTVKLVVPAVICGVLAIASCFVWVWSLDPGPGKGIVEIGSGIRVPTYMTGPTSHGWWAMVVLMLVAGSLYLAFVFSYLYIWTVSPEVWPPAGSPALPGAVWPFATAALLGSSVLAFAGAGRSLPAQGGRVTGSLPLILFAAALLVGAIAVDAIGHWRSGLRPMENSHGAMVYLAVLLNGQLAFAVALMALFTTARQFAGKLDRVRRSSYENTALLAYYTAGQGMFSLLLVHGFPRAVG